jgi:Bacterial capsule synthesis protein PGA_cap
VSGRVRRRACRLALCVGVALALVPAAAGAAQGLPGQSFTLAWGGDVTPGFDHGRPPAHGRGMLAGVADVLRTADVAAVNLEGTLGLGGTSKCAAHASPTCFAFQAPAANAVALGEVGVDIVNLANNHANDYGETGQLLTARSLRRAGIAFTGRPAQIAYIDLPRARIACLGFAPYPWASPLRDLAAVGRLVRRASRRANVVVVFMHAGAEGADKIHTPNHEERAFGELRGNARAFAHAAVNAGADLVLGSGPHVLRGMELYRQRLIAYSLGNLAGFRNFSLRGRSALSAVLTVRVDPLEPFAAGTVDSLRLVGPGLPVSDPAESAGRLISAVSVQDFGRRGVRVAGDGHLVAGSAPH